MPRCSIAIVACLASLTALAQSTAPTEPPPSDDPALVDPTLPKKTIVVPVPGPAPRDETRKTSTATSTEQPPPETGPGSPPPPDVPPPREERFTAMPDEVAPTVEPAPPPAPVSDKRLLDGHPREGSFLAGPGSLTFILHHTIMLSAGGFSTQAAVTGFNLEKSTREQLLAGTLVGAGVGFGFSAWWQFTHWIDTVMANFGVAASIMGGLFFTGVTHLLTEDMTVISWSALFGAELAAWLTATIGGGDMTANHALLISSGGMWGLIFTTMVLAIIQNSGTGVTSRAWLDSLMISPAVGAGALALATLRYHPSSAQVLRADAFGLGAGAAVFLISAMVLGGFGQTTPYVLGGLAAAGGIATVSLLWADSVEPKPEAYFYDPARHRPYSCVWW